MKTHTIEKKGALYLSSYEEEVEAMKEAVMCISENYDHLTKLMICTDSQSLFKLPKVYGITGA